MHSLKNSQTSGTEVNVEPNPSALSPSKSQHEPNRELMCLVYADGSVTTVEPSKTRN
ncbi:MAG: hypothetical protein AAFP20_05305 [Cyanobacteria bacterium J06614_10]